MNYEGQLFAEHHQRFLARERHANIVATHAGLLETTKTMQKVQAHDDETLGSGSSVASLNALDNETDTFGREIMQHERDARRLRNATRGDPQPLLRTRPRPRVSELIARREREEEEEESALRQQHARTASSGSNDSNPPLNIPRDWGTRAKSHRGWMRKIREPSEAGLHLSKDNAGRGLLTPEEDDIGPRRTSYASDNLWSQEYEQAVSTENTPPSMKRARPSSQPTTLRDTSSTLRHIIDSEDQDFGELSLLASTPAAAKTVGRHNGSTQNVGNTEAYNAATHHQYSLTERSPNRNTRHPRSRETGFESDSKRVLPNNDEVPRPATSSYAEARAARRHGLGGNKENVPAHDTREAYTRAGETVTISDRTARAVTFKQHQRPSHTRNGSLHLLQRLATSLSPSPGKGSSDAVHYSDDRPASREPEPRRRATGVGSVEPDQPTMRRPRRKISGTRDENQARVEPVSHNPSEHTMQGGRRIVEETPAPDDQRVKQTPVVTGAWVDTPGPPKDAAAEHIRQHETASKSPPKHAARATYDGPNRPKSALEEILNDARKDPTGPFGDATIQSLEDIAHPNVDPTDTTLTFDAGAPGNDEGAENLDIGRPLTQAEKDRRQEDLAIEAMNKHLRAASTSIKDADRGLSRVENKWDSTAHPDGPNPTGPPPTSASSQVKQYVKVDREWRTVCDHCGGSYHSIWWGLWTELRSNFYTYDKTARFGIRMTWLGVLVLTWLLWNILENALCYQYCHPLYAEYMVGFGVNPDAPRYPFVIPTLLFRPLRPLWEPCLKWVEASSIALSHKVFGESPKLPYQYITNARDWDAARAQLTARQVGHAWSSSWAGKATATAVAAAGKITRSFVDAVDEWGGDTMNDDEYL